MPIELDPDVIDTHAPVLYALAEQLQQEAEDALFITSAGEQLLHVSGIQALIRALMCEVASLITAVRLTVNAVTSDAENYTNVPTARARAAVVGDPGADVILGDVSSGLRRGQRPEPAHALLVTVVAGARTNLCDVRVRILNRLRRGLGVQACILDHLRHGRGLRA